MLQVSRLCNVKINQFTFDQYPWHVDHLYLYSWKPILIHVSMHLHIEIYYTNTTDNKKNVDLFFITIANYRYDFGIR